jgi:uncharacterized protein (TIGR01319 family)
MSDGSIRSVGLDTSSALVLLVDFGSTYTKCVAVDLDRRTVVGQAQAVSTVSSDINLGLRCALDRLEAATGLPSFRFANRLACSSAAGGLRIVAVGLVQSLTVAAARRAALGAGARVVAAYGDCLGADELAEIAALAPDLILLAGGIDGGDRDVILTNAARLSELSIRPPFVVAGNKDAAAEATTLLRAGGKEAHTAPNVLPRLQQIAVEPARALIRRIYLERIAQAKGLDRAEQFVGRVIMPTPAAVLQAVQLLAQGVPGRTGWGSVLCVDIGGATTDVHSAAPDACRPGAVRRGLPEPYAMRTVEGDLGLRASAPALLESVGVERLHALCPDLAQDRLVESIGARAATIGFLPHEAMEIALDLALARACAATAVERHVGRLREHHLPTGFCYLQEGKDLTQAAHVVGTGGIFRAEVELPPSPWPVEAGISPRRHGEKNRTVFCPSPRSPCLRGEIPASTGQGEGGSSTSREILSEALFDAADPFLLKPIRPRLWADRDYVTWAMGLLAQYAPEAALELLQRHLVELESE